MSNIMLVFNQFKEIRRTVGPTTPTGYVSWSIGTVTVRTFGWSQETLSVNNLSHLSLDTVLKFESVF